MDMQNQEPPVGVVILNWNGKKDTEECLDSLKEITYKNYEVILVDNGSVDDSAEYFKEKYPYAHLIENKENLGFTGGTNIGIKYGLGKGYKYIFMLNNDCIVEKNFLTVLVDIAEKNKEIGIVGPKLYYYSLPYIIWSAGGRFFWPIGKGKAIGTNKIDSEKYNKTIPVFWVSGCALFKKEVFEKVGLLEDKYFSNYEDLDFCFNARKAGYEIYYAPESVIYHKVAKDWGGLDNPLYIYYQIRNNLLFIKRNLKFPISWSAYAFFFGVSLPRRALRMALKGDINGIMAMFYGVKDFLNGKFYKTQRDLFKRKIIRQKINIGINIRLIQNNISGIGKYILELLKSLEQIDDENEYTLYEYGHSNIIYPTKKKNFKYKIIPKKYTQTRSFRIFWEQFLAYFKFKKDKINVLHGPSFMLPLIKPSKSIITVHDLTFLRYPESFTFWTKMYYGLFFKRSLNNADMVIADSEATKNDLIEYFNTPPKKIRVIYLGVDKTFCLIHEKERISYVKKKNKLPDKFFLFIGLLSSRKNVDGALKAFSKLNTEHKFVIVGAKGWLYDPIFETIDDLKLKDKVIFTGYLDEGDLPAIYNLAEALIFPSLYEGFGLPILEAMACGCPVITSNVSSMPEVAGDAALLIDPKDINSIKDAMNKIVSDKKLRESLVKKGLEQVKRFTWEKTAKETLALYKQVANV